MKEINLKKNQRKVIGYMISGDWVRSSDITRNVCRCNMHDMVNSLERYGFRFEQCDYFNGRVRGIKYRLVAVPDRVRFGRKKKTQDPNKLCRRSKTCIYGKKHTMLGWYCDYLSLAGHSRPCLPAECVEKGVYENRRGQKPRRIETPWRKARVEDIPGRTAELLTLVNMGMNYEK